MRFYTKGFDGMIPSEYGTDIAADVKEIKRQAFAIKKSIHYTMLHFLSLSRHKTLLLEEVPNFFGLQEALMHLLVDAEDWIDQIEMMKEWSNAKEIGVVPELKAKRVIDFP